MGVTGHQVRPLAESEFREAHDLFRRALLLRSSKDEEWEQSVGRYEPGRVLGAFVDGALAGTAMATTNVVAVPGGRGRSAPAGPDRSAGRARTGSAPPRPGPAPAPGRPPARSRAAPPGGGRAPPCGTGWPRRSRTARRSPPPRRAASPPPRRAAARRRAAPASTT
ncbi:GNAT family N-acetyltransferase [Saccharopolyspora shandongensis]|uniref:GNAT family N-acetyltransferase n=1 Tax=Saccharopolyspora shandongensis TaxID=418495 RepID=UPI003F4D8F2F